MHIALYVFLLPTFITKLVSGEVLTDNNLMKKSCNRKTANFTKLSQKVLQLSKTCSEIYFGKPLKNSFNSVRSFNTFYSKWTSSRNFKDFTATWVKVFKNGPSKICGRQPLKNLKWYLGRKAVLYKLYLVHSWIPWLLWHLYFLVISICIPSFPFLNSKGYKQ